MTHIRRALSELSIRQLIQHKRLSATGDPHGPLPPICIVDDRETIFNVLKLFKSKGLNSAPVYQLNQI
jgi:hypothetical protein